MVCLSVTFCPLVMSQETQNILFPVLPTSWWFDIWIKLKNNSNSDPQTRQLCYKFFILVLDKRKEVEAYKTFQSFWLLFRIKKFQRWLVNDWSLCLRHSYRLEVTYLRTARYKAVNPPQSSISSQTVCVQAAATSHHKTSQLL